LLSFHEFIVIRILAQSYFMSFEICSTLLNQINKGEEFGCIGTGDQYEKPELSKVQSTTCQVEILKQM